MNSFLALRQQEIDRFSRERQIAVRQKVESKLRTAEFLGEMVEMFVPLMVDTFTVMGGGEPMLREEEYLTIQEREDENPYGGEDEDFDGPPAGPTDLNEIIR